MASDPAAQIDSYLKSKDSPLTGMGQVFVAAGRKYGVDPALPVAISGAESGFGKYLFRPFNAWGWMSRDPFTSWEQAITAVTSGLKSGYLDQGLGTLPQIVSKYSPGSAGNDEAQWVSNVASFMKELGRTGPLATTPSPSSIIPATPGTTAASLMTSLTPPSSSMSSSTMPSLPSLDLPSLGLGLLNSNPDVALKNLTWKVATMPPPTVPVVPTPDPTVTSPPPSKTPTPGAASSAPVEDVSKWARIASGADRAGVPTKPAVFAAVAGIAQMFGQPLTINFGTAHNQYVSGSNPPRQSQHWTGDAADVDFGHGTGPDNVDPALTKLGRAALMFAGMPPAEAAKHDSFVGTIGGLNILFNTMEGGNHYNHLHVGVH